MVESIGPADEWADWLVPGDPDDPFDPYAGYETPDPPFRARRRRTPSRIANQKRHQKRPPKGFASTRLIAVERATPEQWEVIRSGVMARAWLGLCERCGKRPPDDPHHRWLLSQGGPDWPSNLAALCRTCHNEVHSRRHDAREAGWIIPRGQDPRVRPITLYDGNTALLDDIFGYKFIAWGSGRFSDS
jgi:5-methylcytosine-specific restriction endonuclease McrA